jgi:beta-mannanase
MAAALVSAALLALVPSASAVQFGAHTDGAVYDGSVAKIDALQRRLDRHIGIVNWYQNWSANPGSDWVSVFHPELVQAVTESDRTPLLTWEPWDPAAGPGQPRYRLARIARGEYDGYVERWARGLRDLHTRVFLRPMHEMNGNWYPWSGEARGNDAGDYRAAWRHLHDIFDRVGADNVRWVWCVNNTDVPATRANRMERFYPGARYVDVLSMDGYNWGALKPEWGGWNSFRSVFKEAYHRLKALGDQPIWIAEVGSAPDGGDKGQWVRNMFDTAQDWDRLKAIVWFDVDKEQDWSASPVAGAFRARR